MESALLRRLTDAPPARVREDAARVGRFLEVAATATGRATFYNTLEEQLALEEAAHNEMLALDRGIYAALLATQGTTDRTRQIGVRTLLSRPWANGVAPQAQASTQPDETELIHRIVASLPVPRRLNLFAMLRASSTNNARVRKLILRSILGTPTLESWCVRYRRKLGDALTHAWGKRLTGVLRSILAKPAETRTAKERGILSNEVSRWARERDPATVEECVAFLLRAERPYRLPKLRAYLDARADLAAGATLPYETLEGIRSAFHRDSQWTAREVLELTRGQLTAGQRLAMQAQAERAGVDVDVDFDRHDAVRLYVYAFQRGLDDRVVEALDTRARQTAAHLDLDGQHAALLLDGSASMQGEASQSLRPIAVALALRDAVRTAAQQVTEIWCGGTVEGRLMRPSGATALAEGLVRALEVRPDLVLVVSDGYENTPAGRFDEALRVVRRIGLTTPVFQISPVPAAETGGVRSVAPDVPALPVQRLETLELTWTRLQLEVDPAAGARALRRLTASAFPSLEVGAS